MTDVKLILGLLLAVAALVTVARRIGIPYPILLVIGGVLLGSIRQLPRIQLNPELVFLIFLPPLLYDESWLTSWRDIRANLRPITLLAVGLVIASTVAVAAVAHAAIPDFSWPVALVLGAVVAPTDEVAVLPIIERFGVPRRIVTILEGESLVNDGVSLAIYRVAATAVVTGVFSLWKGGLVLLEGSVGGIAVGLAMGWALARLLMLLDDPPVVITISLLVPYGVYLAAEGLGFSGVLAVVAVGVYLGRQGPRVIAPRTRLRARAFWTVLAFLLNGLLFILVGFQLRPILDVLAGRSRLDLIWYAVSVALAAIVIRVLWVFPSAYVPRFLSARLRKRDPYPPWQHTALVAWTGIRGGISLAAALAIPLTVAGGGGFPQRDLIIFLTFSVILATLVVQGLTLPIVIRLLKLADDGAADREETVARLAATRAALDRLDEIAKEGRHPTELVADLRAHYAGRQRHLRAHVDGSISQHDEAHRSASRRLRLQLVNAEREAIIKLRDDGAISDDVLHRVEQGLDLQQTGLESSHRKLNERKVIARRSENNPVGQTDSSANRPD